MTKVIKTHRQSLLFFGLGVSGFLLEYDSLMPGAGAARLLSPLPGMCGLAWCVWAVVTQRFTGSLCVTNCPQFRRFRRRKLEELLGGIFLEWKGWWSLWGSCINSGPVHES